MPSEDHLRLILDSGLLHLAYLDLDFRYKFASAAYQKNYGWSEPDIAGRHIADVIGERAFAAAKPDLAKVLNGEEAHFERKLPDAPGGPALFAGSCLPDSGPEGRVRGMLVVMQDITALKRREQELRASEVAKRAREQQFEAIFEHVPVGISMADFDGRMIAANPAYHQIIGYREGELGEHRWQDTTHPDDIPANRELSEKLKRGEVDRFQMEKRFIRKGGGVSWVRLSASAVRNEAGEALYDIAVVEDITAQKRAAQALRDSEEKFRGLFETSRDGIGFYTLDGQVVDANPALCDMLGYDLDELKSKTYHDVTPESWHSLDDHMMRTEVLVRGYSSEYEKEYVRSDGSRVPVSLRPWLIRDENGEPLWMMATIRDITFRKEAEERLRQTEERLKFALEGSNDGLWDWNVETGENYVSPRWESMLGYEPCEVGRSLEALKELMHPDDQESVFGAFEEHLRGVTPNYSAEVRMRSKSGAWVWILTRGKVVERDEAGNAVRATGTHTDISELKRAQDALEDAKLQAEDAYNALRSEATERKRMEEQLAQRGKMQAIGELSGGIAHDFNNILMIIDGYTRRANKQAEDPEIVRKSLEQVSTATNKAVKLTKQLLAFGRRQVMEKRVFLVDRSITEIDALLKRAADERYTVEVSLHAGEARIKTDPSELEQAIMNLTVNARHAMPSGGRIVVASRLIGRDEVPSGSSEELKGDKFVEISVADEGVGIEPEVLSRVFEPFFTTKDQGQGTGLGLSMVYAFCQQSGGAIDVESTAGEGTTFRIILPVARSALSDQASEELGDVPRGEGETVLLVEDDEALLALAEETLRELGYNVLTAGNGFEALEVDAEHDGPIDVLLSDVVMPGMGGLEAAQILRETRPDIKIVLMSGYPKGVKAEKGVLPEGAEFLQKPAQGTRIARTIRQLLDDGKKAAA